MEWSVLHVGIWGGDMWGVGVESITCEGMGVENITCGGWGLLTGQEQLTADTAGEPLRHQSPTRRHEAKECHTAQLCALP